MMFTTRVSSSVGTILSSLDEQKIIYLIRIRSMKKKKKKTPHLCTANFPVTKT